MIQTLGHLHLKVRSASFLAAKLYAGCGGYLDKIYKILVDILDVKASLAIKFFHMKRLFPFDYSKVIKLKLLRETLKNEK